MVFPTVGFHPHEADDVTPAMLEELDSLVALPEVVAVGEIGLDFYRDLSAGPEPAAGARRAAGNRASPPEAGVRPYAGR